MSLGHGAKIVTNGLVFAYDMGPNPGVNKSWKGAPTFNASLQDGQNDASPWSGDGSPTSLGIDPTVRFRGRKVAKFQVGTSRNCYINGVGDLSTSTSSTVWTTTIYLKRVDGVSISSVGMYQYVANNSNVNSTVSVTPVENGWYQAVYTRSGLVAGHPLLTGMFNLGATGDQYYFADWQCENNSFSTPFVNGTRSNTQSLLDWTGTNTVTINGLTYNSDGTFNYYGTNGTGLSLPGTNFSLNTQTIECWCYSSSFVQNGFMFEKTTNGSVNTQYSFFFNNSSSHLYYRTYGLTPRDLVLTTSNSGVVNNQWNHMVATFDGSTKRIYVNGVQKTSASTTGTITANTTGAAYIGTYGSFVGYPFNGKIGVTKIYNRALTAAEVAQNFNALRGRYGL